MLPFIIMLGVAGIPLFFLETAFGQFASSGVISIWKASPIFQGTVEIVDPFVLLCVFYTRQQFYVHI